MALRNIRLIVQKRPGSFVAARGAEPVGSRWGARPCPFKNRPHSVDRPPRPELLSNVFVSYSTL